MTAAFNLSQLANNLNTSGQLDATDGLTGAVPVANGGTGSNTAAGARSNLGTNDAANITTGTIATARLGSGTANSTTFLRGDNTWAAPSGGLQLDTNTASGATSYAIGQYIMCLGNSSALNGTYTVYTKTNTCGFSVVQESGFSSVSGTWKNRGAINVNGTNFSVNVINEGLRGSQGSVGIVQRTA